MRVERIKTIAALVTIVTALLLLYLSLRQPPPEFDSRPHEALGQVLAEEAAKLLGSGGRIILITRDTAAVKNPAADAQAKAFRDALRKSGLTISSTNLVKQDPLRIVRVPAGEFLQIMQKQTESDVIVSLLGPPVLMPDQRARLAEKAPKIVALCAGGIARQVNLRELFQEGLLHVAVTSRAQPGPLPGPSSTPRAWFDQLYQVVTTANLSELPLATNGVAQ